MFPMTITIHDVNQLNKILAALGASTASSASVSASTSKETSAADKPKTEKKAETKKSDGAQSTGGTSAPEASAAPSDTGASTGTLNYETEVKPLVLKLVGKVGRDAALAFLQADYQVEKADKVPADKWPELVEKLNKKLAA